MGMGLGIGIGLGMRAAIVGPPVPRIVSATVLDDGTITIFGSVPFDLDSADFTIKRDGGSGFASWYTAGETTSSGTPVGSTYRITGISGIADAVDGDTFEMTTTDTTFITTDTDPAVHLPARVNMPVTNGVAISYVTNFTATANGQNEIDLAWDNPHSQEVQLSLCDSGGTLIGSPIYIGTGTSFARTGLAPSTTEYYRMRFTGGPLTVGTRSATTDSSGPPMLSGWSTRIPVTLDNIYGSTVSSFQVRIDLAAVGYPFASALSNGHDIRVTTSDGTTLLSYYRESFNKAGATGIIWAKVGMTGGDATGKVYLYAGNAGASDATSLDNTFQRLPVASAAEAPSGRTCRVFGDSIGTGYLLDATSQRYSSLVCNGNGWNESNLAVISSQLADVGQTDAIVGVTVGSTDVALWLAGYNDMRFFGANSGSQDDFSVGLLSLLGRLAVPAASRLDSSSGSVTYTGTWGTSANLGGIRFSNVALDKASFSISGTSILINLARATSNASTATIKIDGSTVGTFSGNMTAATSAARGYQPGAILFTGLSAGSHTVEIIVGGAGGYCYFNWAAGLNGSNPGPTVIVAGCLKMPTASYSANSPFNNGSDSVANSFSAIISAAATALAGTGLNVLYRAASVDTTHGFLSDGIHPNQYGASQIAAEASPGLGQRQLAFWKMNEGSGTSAADSAGNSNPLTLIGSPTWGSDPAFSTGASLNFDGSSNFAYNAAFLNTWTPAGCIMGWFNTATLTGTPRLFTKFGIAPGGSPYDGIDVGIGSGSFGTVAGKLYLYRTRGQNFVDRLIVNGNTSLAANTWFHAAITWTGRVWSIWLNGVLDGQGQDDLPAVPNDGSAVGWCIGAYNDGTTAAAYFQGAMADFAVMSRQPLPEEIRAAWLRRKYVAGMGQDGRWASGTRSTALAPTGTATFDQYLCIEPTVIKDGPTDWKLWYSGNNRGSSAIGLAASTDGNSWTRANSGAAVVAAEASQSCVLKIGSTYHIYYSDGYGGTTHVKHRTSTDGITWSSATTVLTAGFQSWAAVISNVEVTFDGTTYHMILECRAADDTSAIYQLGYLSSSDGLTWTPYASNPLTSLQLYSGASYSRMTTQVIGGVIHGWYHTSTQGFGPSSISYATSSDRLIWTIQNNRNPVAMLGLESFSGGYADQIADPKLLDLTTEVRMYVDIDRNQANAGQDGRVDQLNYPGTLAALRTDWPVLTGGAVEP